MAPVAAVMLRNSGIEDMVLKGGNESGIADMVLKVGNESGIEDMVLKGGKTVQGERSGKVPRLFSRQTGCDSTIHSRWK